MFTPHSVLIPQQSRRSSLRDILAWLIPFPEDWPPAILGRAQNLLSSPSEHPTRLPNIPSTVRHICGVFTYPHPVRAILVIG